jgi:hypothetical protein
VSETVPLPTGWKLTSATCVSSNSDTETVGNISLQAGETVTCTFRNTKENIAFTDTQWCPFDRDPITGGSQFRKIFTQEPGNGQYYKLTSSNPGQFYDNVFLGGTPGAAESVSMTLPYPWVTQGANAIQVHDSYTMTTINGVSCFVPGPDITTSGGYTVDTAGGTVSSSGREIVVLNDYATKNYGPCPASCTTVTVSGNIPATGLLYVTIHLDYGLKDTGGYSKATDSAGCAPNPDGDDIDAISSGTGSNPGAHNICDGQGYTFSFTDGDSGSTTVSQRNVMKKNPGVGGLALKPDKTAVAGAQADVYIAGKKAGTVTTDEDGWYMWTYKYTGKRVALMVKLPAFNLTQNSEIKSNAFVQVDFVVP